LATQKEVASHLDLSDRRVRGLVQSGIFPPSKGPTGYDLDGCRLAYIRYLRGLQSGQVRPSQEGQDGEQGADASNYAALLEQEKWRRAKRENDVEEGLVAPVSLLTDALQKAGGIIVATLESLPLLMKRHWPEITGDQITQVKKAVAECRNAVADMKIDMEDGK